jgi:hypothetical protein
LLLPDDKEDEDDGLIGTFIATVFGLTTILRDDALDDEEEQGRGDMNREMASLTRLEIDGVSSEKESVDFG